MCIRDRPNGNWCDAVIEATWSYPEFGEKSGAVNSFIRIQGSDGEATGYTDEEGKDYIREMCIRDSNRLQTRSQTQRKRPLDVQR